MSFLKLPAQTGGGRPKVSTDTGWGLGTPGRNGETTCKHCYRMGLGHPGLDYAPLEFPVLRVVQGCGLVIPRKTRSQSPRAKIPAPLSL